MAEFCLDCWNKLHGTQETEHIYVFEWDLCEGCGECKPVIVEKRSIIFRLLHHLFQRKER